MALNVPTELEQHIDEIVTHYPPQQKRAAVLWLLHLLQEQFGHLGKEQVEWTATKLGLQPINVWELITFYPMFAAKPRGKFHIKVCRTLSCELCGCGGILERLKKKLGVGLDENTSDGQFTISTVECLAACGTGPVMMVNDELFEGLTADTAEAIIDRIKTTGKLDRQPLPPVLAAHPLEKRVLLGNMSKPGYKGTLDDYVREGGYKALPKALGMKPEEILAEIKTSEIRGRGGAGFPCGLKWSFLAKGTGKPIYLVCNADESEPGTFKDRQLLHYDPHQLIEGILVSCFAVGAHAAYIYIRGEMPYGAKILLQAIEEARAKNFIGKNILGKGFDCEIYVHRGAGAYICGEETGLIESLEGKRAYPRIKPPFPAVVGLFGCPTVVNNVETLSNVPHIINNGAAWFKAMGVPGSTGTRLVCVSGPVKRPGYYEFEMGKLTMRQLIFDVCGGLKAGRTLKGVVPGGSSMPVLKADQIDVQLDFESLRKAGTMAGSGGIIVLDDTVDIVQSTLNVAQFYAHESCGQCTPCREGTLWMEKMLHRIKQGHGRPEDVDLLWEVADNIDGKTICPLGEAAAWPVKAFVTKYRSEFEAACKEKGAAMAAESAVLRLQHVAMCIHELRGRRVILDTDLAKIYGVTTKRLNEAVKRNRGRFPLDFAFQLTRQEVANLRSQFATSSSYGGTRYLPYAFTEHGAIMAATVLNSPQAVQMSIFVVRAFVKMRDVLDGHRELARKLGDLEKKYDTQFRVVFDAIRQLMSPPGTGP